MQRRLTRVVCAVLALAPAMAGCSAVFGLDSPEHTLADAADDAPGPVGDSGPDGCASYSTIVNTCTLDYANTDVDLPIGASFDTDSLTFVPSVNITTSEVQTPTGTAVLIAVRSIHLQQFGNFRVTGSKPLIVAARDMIVVDGTVDVSSGGAGARLCNAGPGQNDDGGAGGGAGASFSGTGGAGGNGDSDGSVSSTGGPTNAPVARPAGPLGGCRGGDGGDSNAQGGAGGSGGGTIAVISARIEIGSMGQINANGQGGRGGNNDDSGAGGGGSGGFILLESPMINLAGKLAANGGGGGEGAGANDGNVGATATMSTTRASGGSGNAANGGDGGSGGASVTPNGNPSPDFAPGGGGGGGGGVGFIALSASRTISGNAVVSPPPSTWP